MFWLIHFFLKSGTTHKSVGQLKYTSTHLQKKGRRNTQAVQIKDFPLSFVALGGNRARKTHICVLVAHDEQVLIVGLLLAHINGEMVPRRECWEGLQVHTIRLQAKSRRDAGISQRESGVLVLALAG